jgi:hypothetical protein
MESNPNTGFKPWIGNHYRDQPFMGKRILILDESNYQADRKKPAHNPYYSIERVQKMLNTEATTMFWTKMAAAMIGEKPNHKQRLEFWNSIAFYTYVQESLIWNGQGARVQPSQTMLNESEPAFYQVLNDLEPEVIIVIGFQNWELLPPGDAQELRIEGAAHETTRRYQHSGGSALAFAVRRVTMGFDAREIHPFIKQVIDLA